MTSAATVPSGPRAPEVTQRRTSDPWVHVLGREVRYDRRWLAAVDPRVVEQPSTSVYQADPNGPRVTNRPPA